MLPFGIVVFSQSPYTVDTMFLALLVKNKAVELSDKLAEVAFEQP